MMTRAILWKEIREQFGILMALVVMGSGVIFAAATLGTLSGNHDPFDLRGYSEPGRLAALVLVGVSGLVVGGMLFAGEHENGTAEFILQLPATRKRLWLAKFLAGGVMTIVMALLLSIVSHAAGVFQGAIVYAWYFWFIQAAFVSFAAGAFGSAGMKQVLPACAIGILVGPSLAFIGFAGITLVVRYWGDEPYTHLNYGDSIAFAISSGPLFSGILLSIASFAIFTYPDSARKRHITSQPGVKASIGAIRQVRTPPSRFGIRTLLWFMWRTWKLIAIIAHIFAMLFGLTFLIPEIPVAFVWPSISVIFGVVLGVFCFANEQLRGTYQFWAERSLPPGRLWFAKILTSFLVLLSCLFCLLLPIVISAILRGREGFRDKEIIESLASISFRTALIGPGFPVFKAIFLWPIYGFAAGLFAGMCFQKPMVSCTVGFMTGAATAALWIPSLLSGGLMGWQIWPAPLVVILISRLMIRDWALGRMAKGRGFKKLLFAIIAPLILIAAGIGFRVIEVPECPETEDDIRFSESLPTNDDQQPGRNLKRAIGQLNSKSDTLRVSQALKYFGPPYERRYYAQQQTNYLGTIPAQITFVNQYGYPVDRPDFDEWLDELFSLGEWHEELDKMKGRPPGVFLDPNEIGVFTRLPEIDSYRRVSTYILARGLQEQARGKPAKATDRIESMLIAANTAKHHTILMGLLVGRAVELQIYPAIQRWLERLDHDPALLKRMLTILREQEQSPPTSVRDLQLAEVVMQRNSIRNPQSWYNIFGENSPIYRGLGAEMTRERVDAESSLLQFCWTVPWEKERLRRAIGLRNAQTVPLGLLDQVNNKWRVSTFRSSTDKATQSKDYLAGIPGSMMMEQVGVDQFRIKSWENDRLAVIRGHMLIVALRLFEAEKKRPAKSLVELVPDYLPAIPVDPFANGEPFHYELSNGRAVYLEMKVQPGPSPGLDAGVPFQKKEFQATAAAFGGLVTYPTVQWPQVKPGFDSDEPLTENELNACFAVMSPLIGWPSYSVIFDSMAGGGPGLAGYQDQLFFPHVNSFAIAGMGGAAAASVEWTRNQIEGFTFAHDPLTGIIDLMQARDVPKGQGIVWSVGPDGRDQGGIWQSNRGANSGDLIFLVPPAVKWQPIPMR